MQLTIDEAIRKGVEAHKAGDIQEAERYYRAILKVQPKHQDANHNMGVLVVGVGKVEAALPFFKSALEANGSIAQFWISYINALVSLGRLVEAKAVLDQAKENRVKGDGFEKIEKQLKESPSKNSNTQELPEEELRSLVNLYNQGQYQQAVNQASQLQKKFPNSVNLCNILGIANKGLAKLDKAIEAYTKAVSIKPDFAEAYYNMGNALKDQSKLEEAIEAFNKAVSIKPDWAEAYNNMGNALKDHGKLEEAIEAYNKAVSIKPNYTDAYINIGNALNEQGKLDEAVEAYKKSIFIKSDNAEAYSNMGTTLKDQGKLDEAVEAYKKSIAIKPDFAEAYNNMGNALHNKGKIDEAIEAYTKAISSKPDYADAIVNALSLTNQLVGTALITEEFEKRLDVQSSQLIEMPKFQIYQAIRAFLLSDHEFVRKHLNSYSTCTPSSIAGLKAKDQVFCSAYKSLLQKLIEQPLEKETTFTDRQTVFHLGESHCLSYAHKLIKINGIEYTVVPRITFGAKAYHFSKEKENFFKAITKINFNSLPNGSKVFISFGEIDCRQNEGFIYAVSKLNRSIENIISDTVLGYVRWFAEANKNKNHSLFFFNIPAPIYDAEYPADENEKVKTIIKSFNNLLKETVLNYDLNIIDVYKFTVGHNEFSNGSFHIDKRHLSSDAIPEIEQQVRTIL